jgi:hypothetical protein
MHYHPSKQVRQTADVYARSCTIILRGSGYPPWVEQYLIGENLKVVGAEFSTLSWAIFLCYKIYAQHAYGHF